MKVTSKHSTRTEMIASLEDSLRRLMWQERVWIKAYLRQHSAGLDLPPFMVLGHIAHRGGKATIAELVEHLDQRNTTMTGHIDRLEEHRLIVRKFGGAGDRRKVSVQITPEGIAFLKRLKRARDKQIERGCAEMPATEIQNLVTLLNQYLDRMGSEK